MAALPPLQSLLSHYARQPDSTWTCGAFGALAEFNFSPGEQITFAEGPAVGAATNRGAFRVEVMPELRVVAYETLSKNAGRWGQGLALCLPRELALMGRRTVVTELGPDEQAVRPQDRGAVLFDLGIGKPQSDICVRSTEPETIALLRTACGRPLFAPGSNLPRRMPALSPHRVFRSKAARVEVYQPIPPPDGQTPLGPHTHLRPYMLTGRSHASTVPVPQGFLPALWLFPPHPLHDANGRATAFDADRYTAFQALLKRFGDPAMMAGKAATSDADLSTRAARLGFRIAERQLKLLEELSGTP